MTESVEFAETGVVVGADGSEHCLAAVRRPQSPARAASKPCTVAPKIRRAAANHVNRRSAGPGPCRRVGGGNAAAR